ncbi:PRP1 splicing factor, N-terminal-domain-containing protein [Lipomyces japonicus]|uniref:PRP1 splicing factor, N-terminal-domain-containing protein n=1 Tax=Lipomyces japonicus TaxID=56871 RepID=UPI0034CE9FAF
MFAAPNRDFLNQEAPANYVPGLGRGATGFTTRSDIGPAREGPSEDAIKAALEKKAEQLKNAEEDNDEERYKDNENDEGLFATGQYDEDDEEADRIYNEVDEKMDSRRRARREAREKREQEEFDEKNPKVSEQFADLKRALSTVTDDEWASIPNVGDLTGKNRRVRKALQMQQRFYAVPDSVLASAKTQNTITNTVESGNGTESTVDGTMTDFRQISEARDKMLGIKLDQAGTDSVTGSTNIDPKGYLTSLSSGLINDSTEIGDVAKTRLLLESVIKTNPKHARGWIAAARLEERVNKLSTAKKIIQQACESCPKSEEVWLENMRLNNPKDSRIIVAKAVSNIPKSVKLWQEAMKLEVDDNSKKRVIRKALEQVPQSVTLWKEAVNLEEDPANARILLARAVELIPLSVDLWLALARLESNDNARVVLNKARKAVPTSHEIWVAAAKLQEKSVVEYSKVEMIVKKAVSTLQKNGGLLERDQWIEEAEKCEKEGSVLTCQAIVRMTLGQGVEDEDREAVWQDDSNLAINKGYFETARAILAYALRAFSTAENFWRKAVNLERQHGSADSLFEVLEKAVEACPQSKDMWLLYAKEKLASGDLDGSRAILSRAFEHNPNNEDVWIAAVDVEVQNNEFERARKLLAKARDEAGTERVWIKSVVLERQLKNLEAAFQLVSEGLREFPKSSKLYMMKGQIYLSESKSSQAREAFLSGTKACPKSVALWLLLSRLDESTGSLVRSRSILERAALAIPKSEDIWLERIRLERRSDNLKQARALAAKALQECPNAGKLWAENSWMEARTQRKTMLVSALRKCDNDPTLIVSVARLFWSERKTDKAKAWLERAIKADTDIGDHWGYFYKFLVQYGTPDDLKTLVTQFHSADPKHGEKWAEVAKNVDNFGKSKEQLLKICADNLQI